MKIDSIEFRGYRCFSNDWTGFQQILPVNVIIGRNNSGKSQLIDLVGSLCKASPYQKGTKYRCSGVLDEASLRSRFPENTNAGELQGNHWHHHGAVLRGKTIAWEVNDRGQVQSLTGEDLVSPYGDRSTEARKRELTMLILKAEHAFTGKRFRRLYADRDIKPEPAATDLGLAPDGTGATNIIRRYIVSSSPRLPRELIQGNLLKALSCIFAGDGHFSELQIKVHDEKDAGYPEGHWEVYLGEPKKGLVALSRSGSGLKTVLLVLLNLLVIPEIERQQKASYVYAFEELENNLHPALLRRLFQFLEEFVAREKATVFLTTHSSVALDFFGVSRSAQILHVAHDGIAATGRVVSAHFDHLGVISELGAKPSDLLQANGIIWVEGPSDCVYINRMLDLFSSRTLQEGRDYQCAFYGGSLLARTQFKSPEEAERELVNLFRVNANVVVVCDGDRSSRGARIKDRVRRINKEVRAIPGSVIWVTQAREIENYLPGSVLASALGLSFLPDPGQHELFFPRKGTAVGSSYVESKIQRRSIDKMELAVQAAPHMTKAAMATRFGLEAQLNLIISAIRKWNA